MVLLKILRRRVTVLLLHLLNSSVMLENTLYDWFVYVKRYTIFVPYLWFNRSIFWFAVRVFLVIWGRSSSLKIPEQEGTLLNAIISGKEVPRELHRLIKLRFLALGSSTIDAWGSSQMSIYSHQNLTGAAFSNILHLPWLIRFKERTAELIKAGERGGSLSNLVETICFDVCPTLYDLWISIGYMSSEFGSRIVFVVIVLIILQMCLSICINAWVRQAREEYMSSNSNASQILFESTSLYATIVYFDRFRHEEDRFKKSTQAETIASNEYTWRSSIGRAAQQALLLSGHALASIIITRRIATRQNSVGSFISFQKYWDTVTVPVRRLLGSYQSLGSMLHDAEGLLRLFLLNSASGDSGPLQALLVESGEVSFKNVGFSYDDRKVLLENLNFVAKPGHKIAIVGETGSGKSTILKLLIRILDVTRGSILIDGQDVRSVTQESLREAFGYVPQDPALFDRSIRENVRYGRLNATDEEIEDACKAVALHEQIMSLPDRYESKIGERGVSLSGGQVQRLAIAQVLLRNPRIVLLDEATSAVDTGTEQSIQNAFERAFKNLTTFVVAHRLSTIVGADNILVLQNGAIIEQGTHDELLTIGGKYRELWVQQTTKQWAV